MNKPIISTTILALLCAGATASAKITIDTVTVGNPGNAADTTIMSDGTSGYGQVNYIYNIGVYDVTLTQYCAFLNAVAQTNDSYSLYNSKMAAIGNSSGQPTGAGILRTPGQGYSVIGNSGNNPVTYVSWFDAARFCNWLHNGQPVGVLQMHGTTETGAYHLNGIMNNGFSIIRNPNARYFLPSEDEWYKAAYYDPSLNNGGGGYWQYATSSNSAPGNDATQPNGINQSNYYNSVYSITQSSTLSLTQNYLTDVGAFTNSASTYGTYDQSGNVNQWNESVVGSVAGLSRGARGGFWNSELADIASFNRSSDNPRNESFSTGFRVASIPEPSSVLLLLGCGLPLLLRRRRGL